MGPQGPGEYDGDRSFWKILGRMGDEFTAVSLLHAMPSSSVSSVLAASSARTSSSESVEAALGEEGGDEEGIEGEDRTRARIPRPNEARVGTTTLGTGNRGTTWQRAVVGAARGGGDFFARRPRGLGRGRRPLPGVTHSRVVAS